MLLVTALSVVATLFNPFGARVWSYAVGLSTNPLISRLVTEWQPPTVRHVDDFLFFVSVAAMAVLLARRRPPARWSQMLALGLFLLIALTATRNILWWALAVPPLAASMIANAGLGIAMGNAVPSVQAAAGRRTLTSDEDGVAHAVARVLAGEW